MTYVGAQRVVRLDAMGAGRNVPAKGLAVAKNFRRRVINVQAHPAILDVLRRVAHDFERAGGQIV
jgi:hypothetical protein